MPAKIVQSETHPSSWSGGFATVRDLEILHTVITEKKTTAAAAKLGISQPAVSRALSQIEARSGRVLFRRKGLFLVPTADALSLYEETKPIFDVLGRLRDFEWAQNKAELLRIAVPPTVAHWLEPLIARFLKEAPQTTISLEIATTPVVLELVADQRADLAVADVTAQTDALHRVTIRRAPFVCVVPEGHPLADAALVTVQDLHQLPMILLVKRNQARALIDRICLKAGVTPRVVVETSNALSAIRLAAEGVGATLVSPLPVADAIIRGVRHVPFAPEISFETAFFFSSAGAPSATAQRFVEFVQAHMSPMESVP
jgi:DNA-binding transcriptional LysR family regulator